MGHRSVCGTQGHNLNGGEGWGLPKLNFGVKGQGHSGIMYAEDNLWAEHVTNYNT